MESNLKPHIKKHKDGTGTNVVIKGKHAGINNITDNTAAACKQFRISSKAFLNPFRDRS